MIKNSSKAFTLIELLVVIAIIALLLSVIMPALGLAKEHAKRVVCAAHLKQLGVAIEAYEMENNYKRLALRSSGGDTASYWMGKLLPYVSGAVADDEQVIDVLLCPSAPASKYTQDPTLVNGAGWYGTVSTPWEWNRGSSGTSTGRLSTLGSYGMNAFLGYDSQYDKQLSGLGMQYESWLDAPGDVPLFADAIWTGMWPQGLDKAPIDLQGTMAPEDKNSNPLGMNAMRRFCIDRHSMRVNILFKGLYVDPIELEDLWQMRWHKNYQTPVNRIDLPAR